MRYFRTTFISIAVLMAVASCTPGTGNSPQAGYTADSVLLRQVRELEQSMLSYMRRANPSYGQKDVRRCAAIITRYLEQMDRSAAVAQGMEVVKAAILELNALNEKCDGQLIETEEREQIATIIINASARKGYNTPDEDITEPWREW